VVARSAFLAFPGARIEVESEGGTESEKLKYQFSQVEWDLDLQEIPKPILIPNKKTQEKKKVVMIKDKGEKSKKVEKKIHCVWQKLKTRKNKKEKKYKK
jgi:hypothetical protein